MMRLSIPRPRFDRRTAIAIATVAAGIGAIVYVVRRRSSSHVIDGFAGMPGGPDDGDEGKPPRWPLWGPVHTVQDVIVTPGWFSDVLTSPNDSYPCGANSFNDSLAKQDKHGQYYDCHDLTGLGDPQPLPFQIRLGQLEEPSIVRAEVTVVDVDGVTNATRWRTNKKTSGRKNGNLDVNEYWFEGSRDETCYREVLARAFNGLNEGSYLLRKRLPCSPKTKPQAYHLYQAQRETTPKGWIGVTREWFAKIADGTPYPSRTAIPDGNDYTALYDLSLGVDPQGVFIDGVIAASLPPMTLRVTVEWATRPA